MAWIKTISDDEAEGPLKKMFEASLARVGREFHIRRAMSLNPGTMRASLTLYRAIMIDESPLSRAQRELLATVVSEVNECHY